MAKIANKILNIKAPATPQKIIFLLFFGTKFAAIKPIIIALSAAKIISIKIICKSMRDSSINLITYYKKRNVYFRPWGKYTNLFKGKNFLIKELYIKPKGILSLQKHYHRSEHWLITKGNPKITLNKKTFIKKPNEHVFIKVGSIHRIENPGKKPVKIIESQLGSILKESDIVRYKDKYGRT